MFESFILWNSPIFILFCISEGTCSFFCRHPLFNGLVEVGVELVLLHTLQLVLVVHFLKITKNFTLKYLKSFYFNIFSNHKDTSEIKKIFYLIIFSRDSTCKNWGFDIKSFLLFIWLLWVHKYKRDKILYFQANKIIEDKNNLLVLDLFCCISCAGLGNGFFFEKNDNVIILPQTLHITTHMRHKFYKLTLSKAYLCNCSIKKV